MLETAVFSRVVMFALRVLVAGCRVESEVEFLVQLVEQGLRGLPIVLVRSHGGRTRLVEIAQRFPPCSIAGFFSNLPVSNASEASFWLGNEYRVLVLQ